MAATATVTVSALVLAAGLAGCAGTSPGTGAAASPTGAAPTSADPTSSPPGLPSTPGLSSTPPPTGRAVPEPPTGPRPATTEVTELALVLEDGEVSGSTPLAQLTADRPVRLSITSDVADDVHVHGVDETAELVPGRTAVLAFTPTAPGRFEVELHDARRVLTRLQVR